MIIANEQNVVFFIYPQSENLQDAIYGIYWYLRKEGFKRLLPMIMMRSSRISSMSASIFFDLSFDTFASVNLTYHLKVFTSSNHITQVF